MIIERTRVAGRIASCEQSSHGQMCREDESDLAHQGEHCECSLKVPVIYLDRDQTQHQARKRAEVIHRTKRLEVWQAFQQRVANVCQEKQCHETEDPSFAGIEVLTKSSVVRHFVRKQERAEHVQQGGI